MNTIDVNRLPLNAGDIKPADSLRYLQQLQNLSLEREDVEHLLRHAKAIIDKELGLGEQQGNVEVGRHFNQTTVNVCFRVYYQLLQKYNIEDQYFTQYLNGDNKETEDNFIILYYILLTSQGQHLEPEIIKNKCLRAFAKAVNSNDNALLDIIKTLNLTLKKWPHLEVANSLSLDHVYFCLQSNQLGMRDEMLTLLQHVCLCREKAREYFIRIVNFWPWTYRTKLYMLVSILNKNSLEDLLDISGYSRKEFFKGLRSTLCYKNLLSSSQHVVKALSGQQSKDLLQMCCEILKSGSLQEIRNLHAQWFSRIQQKEELFHLVWDALNMKDIFEQTTFNQQDSVTSYRFVLICSMFSKEILQLSQEYFTQLSEELQRNCFQYDLESQLVIYKFIIDNLNNLYLEDCLEFLIDFSRKHMTVENSQFRNTILGKMPIVINHIAKLFSKLTGEESSPHSTLKSRILIFFQNLQEDIIDGIAHEVYQPKIFCLKLLEILIRSLYGESVTKNSKNCCLKQNKNLAEFLKEHKVFNGSDVVLKLMTLLNDPTGFDDALDLIVILIGMISPKHESILNQAFEMSRKSCTLSDVDESNLSCLYARVAVENASDVSLNSNLFKNIWDEIKARLIPFEKDPLLVCKTNGWHLFSPLNVLNELVQRKPQICLEFFTNMLQTIEVIEAIILKMLNICNNQNSQEVYAASFEDIDKSLEILVAGSKYPSENHEMSRKYLLMSFWLTLKSCCDLTASLGAFVVTSNVENISRLEFLQRCLQVSVNVLTKCRHKGAIEAAGVTIGQLTKSITTHLPEQSEEYDLLHKFLQQLYDASGKSEVSTTRRGAGFSIMFLHIVKNEEQRSRPILRKVIRNLLILPKAGSQKDVNSATNCDRIEALHLHYLCVLVRDTELREAMSKYYNEIMMAAVTHIDNPEWTICNAALQLLGALVPKIVGQRQATEFEETLQWEPSEVTFCEVTRKLDMSYEYILNYCLAENAATGSIILFLEFLHKVEYIHKEEIIAPKSVEEFRQLMWFLLRHPCEKVRKLSAKCFVRSHEFSQELPNALIQISQIIFKVKNENFFEGLIQTLHQGILKLQHDLMYVITDEELQILLGKIKDTLEQNFCFKCNYKFYSLCKLWDLLQLLTFRQGSSSSSVIMQELRQLPFIENNYPIAYDLWLERVQ